LREGEDALEKGNESGMAKKVEEVKEMRYL